MTGEQTAKAAGDSARAAQETGNTGLLVESSNDFIEKKIEPESRPTHKKNVERADLKKKGRKVYVAHCASCHGKAGTILFNRYGSATLDEIITITRDGLPKLGMPAWGNVLSKDELIIVSQYVFALQNNLETPK